MECMLVPDKPTASQPMVLCAAGRWDGGSWMKYPFRAGKPEILPDVNDPNHIPWDIHESLYPSSKEDLTAFLQTWLIFGLLAEVLDANEPDEDFVDEDPENDEDNSPVGQRAMTSAGVEEVDGLASSPSPSLQRSEIKGAPEEAPKFSEQTFETSDPTSPDEIAKVENAASHVVLHHHQKDYKIDRIYKDFIVEIEGKNHITTKHLLQAVQDSWVTSPIEFHPSRDNLKRRYKRLRPCLRKTYYIFSHLPATIDPSLKALIGAIAEIIGNAMLAVSYLINAKKDIPTDFITSKNYVPNDWGFPTFFDEQVKARMYAHGWCPSDISRIANKFKTIHAMHFISLLDKRQPGRSHATCTAGFCKAYQIDPDTYGLTHAEEDCTCSHIAVDNDQVIDALKHGSSLPLLKFVGEKENLRIEVTRSTEQTPYIALSHVWADGLGNPKANELHACKLVKLRRLIEALPLKTQDKATVKQNNHGPYIWLDTLCCPVGPESAKKLSLIKMPQTYKHAAAVLVLDANLQNYSSKRLTAVELLARIFTSSWLRRLWTLQEGALANHLYFQFADRAISLESIKAKFLAVETPLRSRMISGDIGREVDQIEQFFKPRPRKLGGQNLQVLDNALKYRGVSVPTDEPLCIGTLMSLPERPILAVAEHDRMRVVWQLLAKKFDSLPAQMIFFEEPRLSAVGFRWALSSFLSNQESIIALAARSARWEDEAPGYPTPKGLKVQYPGYRLTCKRYDDGRPRNPWRGLKRIEESQIVFRDSATGDWYMIARKETAVSLRSTTAESSDENQALKLFPLHDMMHEHIDDPTKSCFVLVRETQPDVQHFKRDATDAVLISGKYETPSWWENMLLFWREPTTATPVEARAEYQAIVGPCHAVQALLYTIVEPLAWQLRSSAITDELLAFEDVESDEYKSILEKLKDQMKELMAGAFRENEILSTAVKRLWGDDVTDYLWTMIGDWFNHDFWGTRLENDQIWYVD